MCYKAALFVNGKVPKELVLSDDVSFIGDYVFTGCSAPTEIYILNEEISLNKNAFEGCPKLTVYFAGDKEKWASAGGSLNTKTIRFLPKFEWEIVNDVLIIRGTGDMPELKPWSKEYFTSVVIKPGIKSIGSEAFRGTRITDIEIPNTVSKIGSHAFWSCKDLKQIVIPDSVLEIEYRTFSSCAELMSVSMPDSVTKIGDYAFYGCVGLTSISIPNSVTEIDDSAFDGCVGLTSIYIPSSVVSIGSCAFNKCENLQQISLTDSVTEIGSGAFTQTKWYNDQPGGAVVYIGDIAYRYKGRPVDCIQIEPGTRMIANSAFSDCNWLTEVSIPDSVTIIGRRAFDGCTSLSSISIPNSVLEIGSEAFCDCSGLTSITLPTQLTIIEESTFSGCDGLTKLTIPDSVSVIKDNAFSGCTNLSDIHFPNLLTSVGVNMNQTHGYDSLLSLYFPQGYYPYSQHWQH